MIPPVTLCLTFGNRPDLLRTTLSSLQPVDRFAEILGVNDFGDEASNAVFLECCPTGQIIKSPAQRLQHVAIDAMYSRVTTPLIMHCEDDWQFDPVNPIPPAYDVLTSEPDLSVVGFWKVGDPSRYRSKTAGTTRYLLPKDNSSRFNAFTLQPSLFWRATWEKHGPYARFSSEGKIGQHMRAAGLSLAYLDPGLCSHIGQERSVAHVSGWARMRRNILTRYHAWGLRQ